MKKIFYLFILILSLMTAFTYAQRAVTHTIKNFNVNTAINKFSFDIFSISTGATPLRVGLTSYYINFNQTGLSSPLLSNINSKYTTGSSTGDYDAMAVQTVSGNKIAVSINYSGNGAGTGDLLSTSSPDGERICTVTLDIIDQAQTADISWDMINSAMQSAGLQSVSNSFNGSFNEQLPVELSSFIASINQSSINLKWQTKSEIDNYGFEIERAAVNPKSNPETQSLHFDKIGFVSGSGNSNSPKDYTYTDKELSGGNKYVYRLKQIDNTGAFEFSDLVEVEIVPAKFELSQNYPNPFNPSTNIKFVVPRAVNLSLSVYNMLGEKVRDLISGFYEPGIYNYQFDGSNLASGTYIYRLQAEDFVQIKKMMLIK